MLIALPKNDANLLHLRFAPGRVIILPNNSIKTAANSRYGRRLICIPKQHHYR